jgi:hypothetical protein
LTPQEYIQLKAFARVDGALTALLWVVAFAFYIAGLTQPEWLLASIILMVASPFYIARRLRLFRDEALGGVISFSRSWGYVVLVFFYGSLLLALAEYAYFAFLDRGFLMQTLQQLLGSAETQQVLAQYGMKETVADNMAMLQSMRPIDLAVNMLTTNLMLGIIMGLPIAFLMKRSVARVK